MPVAKIRENVVQTAPVKAPAGPTGNLEGAQGGHSPVLALQDQIAQRAIGAELAIEGQWSTRRALVLIVSASAALWIALLAMGAEATSLVA